jgi:hydroxypyruvate reductase
MMGRALLRRLYASALEGADPEAAVRRALERPDVARALAGARRVGLFAVGKAAARMTSGARSVAAAKRLVILPRGHAARGLPRREVVFARHPEPDSSSVRAARRALRFFREFGERDVVLCLVSGGTSSLLALPRPGLTLAEKRRRVRALAASGASILALNRLRTSLSAVKGGRLGRATRARLVTLVLSDVPGDRAASVGSGPTVRRGRRGDVVRIVGSNRIGLDAAAREAARLGLRVTRVRERLAGESRKAGARLGRIPGWLPPGTVLLAGGETVVTLGPRAGRGGRTLELALAAAAALADVRCWTLLAASSDGLDGSAGAAGAWADGGTISRARRAGLDPAAALARHDTRAFFAAAGDLFVTGPTGGNVGDWVFIIQARNPARRRPV